MFVAAAFAVGGIAFGLLLPLKPHCFTAGDALMCRPGPDLLLRFGVWIGSLAPIAFVTCGRLLTRWTGCLAVLIVASGVALAMTLPSDLCPGQLVGAFCSPTPDHAWARFGFVSGSMVTAALLFLLFGRRGSGMAAALLLLCGGVIASVFLPSTTGLSYPSSDTVILGTPDARVGWRLILALSGLALAAITWRLSERLPRIRLHSEEASRFRS